MNEENSTDIELCKKGIQIIGEAAVDAYIGEEGTSYVEWVVEVVE